MTFLTNFDLLTKSLKFTLHNFILLKQNALKIPQKVDFISSNVNGVDIKCSFFASPFTLDRIVGFWNVLVMARSTVPDQRPTEDQIKTYRPITSDGYILMIRFPVSDRRPTDRYIKGTETDRRPDNNRPGHH